MAKLLRAFNDRKMPIVLAMGFASGLPLLLTGSTLQAWFRLNGLSLSTIGLFSLVGVPYTLKFIWAPLLDRYIPPFLGRRRGWLMVTQLCLAFALLALAASNPKDHILPIAIIAIGIAFFSATQDISIDAYRREILPNNQLGFGTSLYVLGYRLGMILASAGALIIADHGGFPLAYTVMAGAVTVSMVVTWMAPEPNMPFAAPKSLREAFVEPVRTFLLNPGAIWILAFILLYKLGDNMATALTTPLYMQLGYSMTEIGAVGKICGIWATIVGGLIGGSAMIYLGMRRSLWIFGILQAVANMSFAWLWLAVPKLEPAMHIFALGGAITVENITAGMGTAAYTAFMASLTNRRYTASQYALLTSLMGIPRVIATAPAGFFIDAMGWVNYFILCTACCVPGLLLLLKVGQWAEGFNDAEPAPKS